MQKRSIAEWLAIIHERLHSLGINVWFSLNYPWVYVDSINGIKIKEKYNANHGYCIGYYDTPDSIDLKALFKIIRKYI